MVPHLVWFVGLSLATGCNPSEAGKPWEGEVDPLDDFSFRCMALKERASNSSKRWKKMVWKAIARYSFSSWHCVVSKEQPPFFLFYGPGMFYAAARCSIHGPQRNRQTLGNAEPDGLGSQSDHNGSFRRGHAATEIIWLTTGFVCIIYKPITKNCFMTVYVTTIVT